MNGIDYAGSSPGAAAVKAAGFGFVARYLSRYTSKVITAGEYNDMNSNAVGVVLVFEDYANQALSGYNQGVADAQVALSQANAIGWPSNRPIHFAVDFDISDAQKPAAGQYMLGAASVLGLARTGAYGGYWWIKYCADNNLAAGNARWQATAWSGGMIHPTATLFQELGGVTVNGTSCDIDKSLTADFGQSNIAEGDIMDHNDGIEFYRFGLHREPSNAEADLRLGQKFSDAANPARGSQEWEEQDNAIKDYPNQVAQVATLTSKLTTAQQAATDAESKVAAAQAAEAKAEAALKALQDQTNTDTQTGNAFLRWLGGILSKLKG